MTTPHKHADLIRAWADGAQIQVKLAQDGWVDCTDNRPAWLPEYKYRVKPSNVILFMPVATGMGSRKVSVGWGVTSRECAGPQVTSCASLLAILRIEINPDTLELVSATMEKP